MICMDFPRLIIGEERKRRAWTVRRARSDFRVCCCYGDELDELIKIYPPCNFMDLVEVG